jgi:hypothetical protein
LSVRLQLPVYRHFIASNHVPHCDMVARGVSQAYALRAPCTLHSLRFVSVRFMTRLQVCIGKRTLPTA